MAFADPDVAPRPNVYPQTAAEALLHDHAGTADPRRIIGYVDARGA